MGISKGIKPDRSCSYKVPQRVFRCRRWDSQLRYGCLLEIIIDLRKPNTLHSSSQQRKLAHCISINYLKQEKIDFINYCSYSPDLASSDLLFFWNLKWGWGGSLIQNKTQSLVWQLGSSWNLHIPFLHKTVWII